MSQSTTFYRVSREVFLKLKETGIKDLDLLSVSKGRATIQGTAMALQHLLSKGKAKEQAKAIAEAFAPKRMLFEDYEMPVAYSDAEPVGSAALLIESVTDQHLVEMYDPEELNRAGIYPGHWRWGSTPDEAYTEKHLLDDFESMKELFTKAAQDGDFIVTFSG
jgi:hypothetical protein